MQGILGPLQDPCAPSDRRLDIFAVRQASGPKSAAAECNSPPRFSHSYSCYTRPTALITINGQRIERWGDLVSYQNRRTYESGSARQPLEKLRKEFEDKELDPSVTGAIYEFIVKPV